VPRSAHRCRELPKYPPPRAAQTGPATVGALDGTRDCGSRLSVFAVTERMTDIREDRKTLFSRLQSPETQPQFWARVADDVDWTVEGTHPLAGRYHNKQEFIDATFGRLAGVLVGGVKLESSTCSSTGRPRLLN
jgi:ketosteroid isomerase-like protein